MFWIHSLKLTASSPLKIGTPWKSGDSELGNHHFQVQTCNFGFREDILSVSCQFRNFNQKASGKRWSLPQNESVLKGRSVPNARWIGLIEWRILYLKIQQLNQMGVSKNRGGPPKSSILIGFSTVNHPFWGAHPYFWKHPDSQQQTWILVSNYIHVTGVKVPWASISIHDFTIVSWPTMRIVKVQLTKVC